MVHCMRPRGLDLSEKNPLEVLPHDATIIQLLTIFARGTHRGMYTIAYAPPNRTTWLYAPRPIDVSDPRSVSVLIQGRSNGPGACPTYLGLVSDRALLAWFTAYAQRTPTLLRFLSVPLSSVALPSLYLYAAVVAAKASDQVLDAMRLMSDEGVSSVAVVDDETKGLLSAVSVTDIGRVVVPAQSNAILGTGLQQLIAAIKVRVQLRAWWMYVGVWCGCGCGCGCGADSGGWWR